MRLAGAQSSTHIMAFAQVYEYAAVLTIPIAVAGIWLGRGLPPPWQSPAYTLDVASATAVLLVLCVAPAVWSAARARLDLFELGVSYGLVYFLYFGARSLWILHVPQTLDGETPYPSVVLAALPAAIWYADIGMAAYLVGYRSSFGRSLPEIRLAGLRIGDRLEGARAGACATALYLLGFVARWPDLTHGWFMGFAAAQFARQVPAAVQSLTYFSVLGVLAYALLVTALCVSPLKRFLWLLAAVIVPTEILFAFVTGSKFALITLLCVPMLAWHYLRRPVSPATVVALVAVVVLIVTPLVGTYRASVESRGQMTRTAGDVPRVLAHVGKALVAQPVGVSLGGAVSIFLHRLSGIDGLAVVLRGVPSTEPFARGRTLAWTAKLLMPTAVWPDKYDRLHASLLAVPRLFGYPDFIFGGIGLTEPAELYLNFGVTGLLLGMALIGGLHGLLVGWLRRPNVPLRVFVYSLLWPWVMMSVEGWFYAVYPNLLRIAGLSLLVAWAAVGASPWRRPQVSARQFHRNPPGPPRVAATRHVRTR
jgi:hypothetical protein